MAEQVFDAALESEQQGDIRVDAKTRLGNIGGLDSTKAEVTIGSEYATATVSADKTKVNVKATGVVAGEEPVLAQVTVTADKNKDPNAEDNEVGIFNITITPAGTASVAFSFENVRPVDQD